MIDPQSAFSNGGFTGTTNEVSLVRGDRIDFVLGSSGEWSYDSTTFEAAVEVSGLLLSIIRSDSSHVAVSWLPALPGTLQQRDELASGDWQDAATGAANPGVLPIGGSGRLFRVIQP